MNAKLLLASSLLLVAVILSIAQPPPGTILWEYDAGSYSIHTSPTIVSDSTVYVGIWTNLVALTNDGSSASIKWSFAVAAAAAPAVGYEGTLYFIGGPTNALFAVNPDGIERWTYYGGGGGGTPAIGRDNTLYFQGPGFLFAVNPTGTLKWQASVPGNSGFNSPVVAEDGTIYVGASDTMRLHAFTPAGIQKWAQDLPNPPGDSIALGRDGTIYLSAGPLHAFTPGGTKLWSTFNLWFNRSPLAVANNDAIFLEQYWLFRVSPDGQALATGATDQIRGGYAVCPVIDAAGIVWHCASNALWAVSLEGQVLPWSRTFAEGYPSPYWSPTLGYDGILYAVRGNRLYAIATSAKGPLNAPWPMLRQNPRQTGKVENPLLKEGPRRNDANFQFQLYAQLGQTNTVETSTNLISWIALMDVVVTNVPLDVIDLTASNSPTRFYRAVAP